MRHRKCLAKYVDTKWQNTYTLWKTESFCQTEYDIFVSTDDVTEISPGMSEDEEIPQVETCLMGFTDEMLATKKFGEIITWAKDGTENK